MLRLRFFGGFRYKMGYPCPSPLDFRIATNLTSALNISGLSFPLKKALHFSKMCSMHGLLAKRGSSLSRSVDAPFSVWTAAGGKPFTARIAFFQCHEIQSAPSPTIDLASYDVRSRLPDARFLYCAKTSMNLKSPVEQPSSTFRRAPSFIFTEC